MEHLVTATFKTHEEAEDALRKLELLEVRDSQISVVLTDEARKGTFNLETNSKVDEGMAGGATFGGIVGAVFGALAAAGTLAVPGLNLVVTGPLVGALAGLAAGATAGSLVGGLIGMGIPEHEAKIYETEVKNGAILVAIKAKDGDQKKQIKDAMKQAHAYNIAA